MRLRAIIVFAIVLGGLLIWEFVPIQVKIWDGYVVLTVHVSRPNGNPQLVGCKAFSRRNSAEEGLLIWTVAAKGFDGAPLSETQPLQGKTLKVSIPTTSRESPMGRETRFAYCKFLLVIAQLQDGQRIGEIVEVPDPRITREITVTLP